jgi:hypothetical protein
MSQLVSIPCQFTGQPPERGIILFPVNTFKENSAKIFGAIFINEDMPRMGQAGIALTPAIPIPTVLTPPSPLPQQQQQPVPQAAEAVGFGGTQWTSTTIESASPVVFGSTVAGSTTRGIF